MEPLEGAKRRDADPDGTRLLERIAALEAMLDREREISADLKEDRDRWRQQATALLTDQRPNTSTGAKWWPWRRNPHSPSKSLISLS